MIHIKIKIKGKEYKGTIKKTLSENTFLVEYFIGDKKTTGIFKSKDFEIIEEQKIEKCTLIKREHFKIECQCGYHCCAPKSKNGFGKCPRCMSENWTVHGLKGFY